MLDKSIPYKNIIMKMPWETAARIAPPPLPDGFCFRFFQDGAEKDWARIETSVLEFPGEAEAGHYYAKTFLPYREQLKQRCLFVVNPQGLAIATATAWYSESRLGRQAALHWVSTCPHYQGKGLGRAIVCKALSLFPILEPQLDVFLHTQTWSYPAILLYHSLGFAMTRREVFADIRLPGQEEVLMPNDFDEAIAVLSKVLQPHQIDMLAESAV